MAFSIKRNIKDISKNYGFLPSKKLGQNFLVDKTAIGKVIESAEIKPEDLVLEIGPGLGVLTKELTRKTERVMAVEKDQRAIDVLRDILNQDKNIKIIKADILKLDTGKLPADYKLIGNIPFYLTSPVIRKFLETENRPKDITLIVQKEMAKRITAKPPEMSILAVSVQVYAKAKIISYIPKDSFWPKPKVDSAIIRIIPFKKTELNDDFFKIVKAGFSQPRKQLLNNLVNKLGGEKSEIKAWLLKNNIKPEQRAETLEIADWINLSKSFKIKQYEN